MGKNSKVLSLRVFLIASTVLFIAGLIVGTSISPLVVPQQPVREVPGEVEELEVRIGGTVSLTGPFAGDVGVFDRIMNAFADLVNERGGVFVKQLGKRVPIRFVIYDDASDVTTAIKFYEKLITEDRVHILIGPFSSKLSLAIGPIAEKHGIPIVWTEAAAPKVFQQGWKWAVGVLDERLTSWGEPYFVYILKPLVEKGEIRTIALIHDDTPHSIAVNEGAKILSDEIGLSVVMEERFPFGATDFSGIVAKLKAANPDVIHFKSDSPPSGVAFVRQVKESGINPREFYFAEPVPGVLEALGKDADYLVGASYWVRGVFQGPYGDGSFLRELEERSGVELEKWPWFGIHYPAMQAIVAALEAAGSLSPEDILEALRSLHIMTISGPLKFDGQRGWAGTIRPVTVQVFEGRYRVIAPPEFAKFDHLAFVPWEERG